MIIAIIVNTTINVISNPASIIGSGGNEVGNGGGGGRNTILSTYVSFCTGSRSGSLPLNQFF